MNFVEKTHDDKSVSTLIFTATFNEHGNIEELLDDIWREFPSADVLVVDDNSPDGTGTLLDQIASTKQSLKVVHRPGKLGLGTAHHLAMIYAIKHGYKTLVTMDADHSHDPKDMRKMIERLADADFVIGSRYMHGGVCEYNGYRKFVSITANTMARLLLGIPLHEFTTSYRAFRVTELAKVNFAKMHNQGYSFFMESVYRFKQAGLRLAEVPINFGDRNAGVSKIPRFEILQGMAKLVHLFGSRLMRRTMPTSSLPIEDTCANCGSIFLSEKYPRQLSAVSGEDRSNVFKCSSMGHTSKPRVVKCLQCGLSQVPISEHPSELDQLYSDVVDQDYLNNLGVKKKTFSYAYKRLSAFLPESGKMLEIGSYCGLFLMEAKKHGWSVKGVEPSRWASEYSRASFGLDVTHGNFEQTSTSLQGEFDAIVSWDVLEHVSSPKEFIRTAHGLLKTGGILALSTLDIDTWFPRILGRRWPWIMEMHLYYFGAGSLERMLEEAGFKVLRVEPYRHYASLRYIYRKLCSALPDWIGGYLIKGHKLVPNFVLPVTLGDIRLYVVEKV